MAAIGSIQYDTKVNRALTTSRQMASTFKPVVFLAAFEKGIKPSDQIIDMPYDFRVGDIIYRPNNYNGYFMGKIPIRYAFTYSLNNSTVKLAEHVGLDYICELSKSMGMNLCYGFGCISCYPIDCCSNLFYNRQYGGV